MAVKFSLKNWVNYHDTGGSCSSKGWFSVRIEITGNRDPWDNAKIPLEMTAKEIKRAIAVMQKALDSLDE